MNMVTPAMQLASKIPDTQVQLWATALLKGTSFDIVVISLVLPFWWRDNLFFSSALDLYGSTHPRQQEAIQMHNQFTQVLLADQYQALAAPEHGYINVSDVLEPVYVQFTNLWIIFK